MQSDVPAPLAEFGLKGEEMRLALIAILLAVVVTIGIHAFSPNLRAKMFAIFQRNRWVGAEHCLLFVFGYAVPIYLLLYVDSCSQWAAIE
jgi:hypothetical protein